MRRKAWKKTDYRIEVFRENENLAWGVVNVDHTSLGVETYVGHGPLERLQVYELLLLFADGICPFPHEERWLANRIKEHARIEPDEFVKQWNKDHPADASSGEKVPF